MPTDDHPGRKRNTVTAKHVPFRGVRMPTDDHPRQGRVQVLYVFIFLILSTLVLRMGYLQIVHGASFRSNVNTTTFAKLVVLPSRGRIYDAQQHLLAYDQPSFCLVLTRLNAKRQDYAAMARHIAPVFHKSAAELEGMMTHQDPGLTQVRILQNVTLEQVTYVVEHQSILPGLHIVEDPKRAYRYGSLAGHVVGYVHPIPAANAKGYSDDGYLLDEWVGLDGVERSYESVLHGRPGEQVLTVNSFGVPQADLGLNPAPVAGNNIELTIDGHLQARAQEVVVDELRRVKRKYHYNPQDAEVVLLDAHTGGVLSLVSYPYYNPAWYTSGSRYEAHAAYLNGALTPMIDHVLQSPRAPGSTVKPVNILVGLAHGAITPYTTIHDPGYAVVGDSKMKDWQPWGHGVVGPITAIAQSCDTFMYEMGMWLAHWHDGPPQGEPVGRWIVDDRIRALNQLYDAEAVFGLGPRTGVDLPYEVTGHNYDNLRLYSFAHAKAELRRQGYYDDQGTLYDVVAAAIGQNQQFTPMQLADYALTLANCGTRLRPHVLHRVITPDGHVIRTVNRVEMGRVPFPVASIDLVRQGMWAAVNRPGGTAYRRFLGAPYQAAGKTGTAQIERNRDISLFIGYAPADHPQVCIAVMVPGGGESGETAVPIARALFDAYFREHHEFFPATKWTGTDIPPRWGEDQVLLS